MTQKTFKSSNMKDPFAQGFYARIIGDEYSSNPHRPNGSIENKWAWEKGWDEADSTIPAMDAAISYLETCAKCGKGIDADSDERHLTNDNEAFCSYDCCPECNL